MRVIGAGWGRTGTTSLAAALDRLGAGPCLQMQEMWSHPELVDVWNGHRRGERVDWRRALSGWQSTVDWPGCTYWEEYADIWPDAIVVLSLRHPARWYESVRGSIHDWTEPGKDVGSPGINELVAGVWELEFGGWDRVLDQAHAIDCFERHNQQVRATCSPARLVEWTTSDGWGPLCRALGVAEPDEPFPHLNSR